MGKKSGWLASLMDLRPSTGTARPEPGAAARPPRSPHHRTPRFPWEAEGTTMATLMRRRCELLEMNLAANKVLQEEWMLLILTMDGKLNAAIHDPHRRLNDSSLRPRAASSPLDVPVAAAAAEASTTRSPGTRARSFLSEFVDDAGSHHGAATARRGAGPSPRTPTSQLLTGMLPGTRPNIEVFTYADFSPGDMHRSRDRDRDRDGHPAAAPAGTATLSAMVTPSGPDAGTDARARWGARDATAAASPSMPDQSKIQRNAKNPAKAKRQQSRAGASCASPGGGGRSVCDDGDRPTTRAPGSPRRLKFSPGRTPDRPDRPAMAQQSPDRAGPAWKVPDVSILGRRHFNDPKRERERLPGWTSSRSHDMT